MLYNVSEDNIRSENYLRQGEEAVPSGIRCRLPCCDCYKFETGKRMMDMGSVGDVPRHEP